MKGATFWLLDGRTGWRRHDASGVSQGRESLRLSAAPDGPLALLAPDGSLGRLVPPYGLASGDAEKLYLLDRDRLRVRRFDPDARAFVDLPAIGGASGDARGFVAPTRIAVAGRRLYVADPGAGRVQAFDLPTLTLVERWEEPDWEPLDLFAGPDGAVYVLDARHRRVYGRDRSVLVDDAAGSGSWSRVAADRDGRIYLLDAALPRLEIFAPDGRRLGEATDPGEVRDRFDPPAIVSRPGIFLVPPADGSLAFDPAGEPVAYDPTGSPGPPAYVAAGTWVSRPLDSSLDRCQWHRVVLELGALPPGCRLEVWTHADEDDEGQAATPELEKGTYWDGPFVVSGPMQSPQKTPGAGPQELLVQSREGRFLRLGLRLAGDGFQTPAIEAVRVHYPRSSYLQYLPAVYAMDEESRWFLQRFLSIFQTEWDRLEQRVDETAALFDPASVPGGPLLAYLARWLGQPLEQTWSEEQKRRLLMALPAILPRRGTPEGLRRFLQAYLQNLTGLSPDDQQGYPQIVEGFRERERLRLSREGTVGAPLWSASAVGRLQLGVFAREGEVRLVSTSDPEHDAFSEFAHRFRVFVPAAWIQDRAAERMLLRALDSERPAHTQFDLCLIEPRFRVGVQSTIGLDTILGACPAIRLACGQDDPEAPTLRAPRGVLGYDTVLSGAPGPENQPGPHLGPGSRLGMDGPLL